MSAAAANEAFDVFISYARADGRHAAELDSFLREKGLTPFFDRRILAAGRPWVRALEQAINAAKGAIVLIGPRGIGDTQQYERDLALLRQTRDPAFPVVPVILPGTAADRPFDFLHVVTWVDFSHVTKVSEAPEALDLLLIALRGGQAVPAAPEAICPYRGLDAFREEDTAFFFGRGSAGEPESPVGQLVGKVREHPFVMVVGRSGSGKSSLVNAGLLPALRRERDRLWNALTLRPGPSPLRALAAAFNPHADGDGAAAYQTKLSDEADRLRTGAPDLLAHMIREGLHQMEGRPDRLLLYIDQWEELYAQAPSGGDPEAAARHAADVTRFVDLLLTAARTAPVTVVGTVRADFYDPLIAHPEIRALLPARQVLLGSMPRSDLERTIVEPARKAGLAFDPPKLVQRIVDEAGDDEGMLPLLQYALKESWGLREGSRITAGSYARSGGVREAIRVTAEGTFDTLSGEDQRAARQLFLRLVTPGEGQEDTRARAAMPSEPALRRIVDHFAGPRIRLLVTGSDRALRPTVEVAHEALIRTWPRLRRWVDASREKLRSRAAVLQAKQEWEQQGRREDLLLHAGFQLERARTLLADPGDLSIDDIEEFVALSSAREESDRRAREAALARDEARVAEIQAGLERTARLQQTARRAFAAVAAVILIAGLVVGYLQWDKVLQLETIRVEIEHERATKLGALSETSLPRGEIDSALRLALHGARIDLASPQASPAAATLAAAVDQAQWRLALSGHYNVVNSAAFNPDGSRVVTASADKTARIWEAATAREIAVLRHPGIVFSAAYSSDGALIATASADKTVRIWDVATATEIAVLRGHGDEVHSADFSRDGSLIVTASADRTARIWDVATLKEIKVLRGHADRVSSAAFSPDGSRVVTASGDKTARVWDVATARQIAVLSGHDGSVLSAVFSRNGSRIVTASADKTARIWDAGTSREIAVLPGHRDIVSSAAFSPDGSRIVTTSWDKTVRIWYVATATQIALLRGHDGSVYSAAFSRDDGSRIVTASSDKTARIWDVTVAGEIAVLRGHDGDITSAAFSPDGSRIVTASSDMTARIWDAVTARQIAILRGHGDVVSSASFSPDGSRIVTTSWDNTARVWEVATTAREIAVLPGDGREVSSVAFSPGGSRIVTTSWDNTARTWDAMTGREIVGVRGRDDVVSSAAFSPDRSRVVTASWDNTARIWDAVTRREIAVLRGHDDGVISAAFSLDGSRIVTASADNTARVWDAATAREIGVLRGHDGPVRSAAFSADGSRIVTTSNEKTARIWDVHVLTMPVKTLLAEACARLSGLTKLTREEMRLAGYPDDRPEIDVCQ
jgi:WD40 repeat protein/energy-coupling factor transporter ATP-binding protein EcfA2